MDENQRPPHRWHAVAQRVRSFAQYLLRYALAYDSLGVPIYAITVQNEPHFEPTNYPGMRLDPSDRGPSNR